MPNLTAASLTCRQRFVGVGGISLVVEATSFGVVSVEDAISGVARPIAATATQDGRGVDARWHEGPESEAVYFERYDEAGRCSHGWVDSVTRRIVQVG